jgi:hypothetical protein
MFICAEKQLNSMHTKNRGKKSDKTIIACIPGCIKILQKMSDAHPLLARLCVGIFIKLLSKRIVIHEPNPCKHQVKCIHCNISMTSQISFDKIHDVAMRPERSAKSAATDLVDDALENKKHNF